MYRSRDICNGLNDGIHTKGENTSMDYLSSFFASLNELQGDI